MKGLFFSVLLIWSIFAAVIIRTAIHTLRAEVAHRDMLIETLKTDLSTAESVYETQLQQQQAGARAILDMLSNHIIQLQTELEWYQNQHRA